MSNIYRTHTCGDLSNGNIGERVKLSGWVDTKRDHGGVLFIDLRDNYGKIQIVADEERCKISNLDVLARVHNESVICVDGKVVERSDETKNPKIKNGDIEVLISKFEILSNAEVLPFQVNEEDGTNEEVRLKYRFLELRKEKLHNTIIFRAKVFAYIELVFYLISFLSSGISGRVEIICSAVNVFVFWGAAYEFSFFILFISKFFSSS